ncbi:VID27 cytoplasmic protein-domain-containing protein [Gaertneriomyces semiglobifer]|nr:VID27 cytoplasmic protein-domain-containing protein [Gaertneriomyces semiglobifer]
MFLLKNLGSLVFGGAQNDSMVQLPAGQLYRVNNTGSAVSKKLIFPHAEACIRRTTNAHNYQLIITRLYEDGEEEADDDELLDDERVYLIDEALRFRRLGRKPPYCLQWADPSEGGGWEFAVGGATSEPQMSLFEDTVYTCMFERKHGKSHGDVDEDVLSRFVDKVKAEADRNAIDKALVQTASTPNVTPISKKPLSANTPSSLASSSAPATPTPASKSSKPTPAIVQKSLGDAMQPVIAPEGEQICAVKAQLYLFDSREGHFALMKDAVTAEIIETGVYEFALVVKEKDTAYICQPVDQKMAPTFSKEHRSFVWVWYDPATGQPLYSWSLKFEGSENEELEFKQILTEAVYETSNREEFRKLKKDDQEFLLAVHNDPMEVDQQDDEREEDEEEEWEEEEEEKQPARTTSADDSDEEDNQMHDKGSKNSQLAVGYKHNSSFVVRGSKIGVFRHTDDDQLRFATTINNVSDLSGQFFSPRKVMLHEQDSSMVLMKPGDDHNLYKMDLEYGKVVEQWKVDDSRTVDEIVPDNKYAQMTPAKTLIGLSHNSIYRIDPRLAGNKLVEEQSKQYVMKNGFSCGATTGKGDLVVGSSKGELRLYDQLNKRAKTHLPGMGDPIIGVDTTENGRWIVATCRTHLLLIDTQIKGSDTSGFSKSMGANKPAPKRLQLKPEHVAWMGCVPNFTTAKFSTGDAEEQAIITSTGPYVIRWNFRRVKGGHLYDYTIKRYADNVVADNFKYGQDRTMIVTLPENVEMITKKSLSTPVKMLKSRSNIVNSPY